MIFRRTPSAAEDLKSLHTPDAVRERLQGGFQHSYLRDFIYGAIDGTVTTFAIVAGVAGADLSAGIVLVLGLANVLADGFSMAASNLLGTRAEQQRRDNIRRTEEMHIRANPEGEREEIRQIFADKGFSGEQLEDVVQVITSDRQQWVDTMLREEHGLSLESGSAWKAAAMTFTAFVAIGLLPLLAYISSMIWPGSIARPFVWSAILTGFAFFAVGAVKGRIVEQTWWRSGLETLLVGGVAATIAYFMGAALKGLA